MNRYGEYDFPAPPPLTEEFECIPFYEQPLTITEQPERIFGGQSDRPRLPEKTFKGPYYGGKEEKHPSPKQGLLPLQSRDADSRFLRDDSVARATGQSKTMPRSGQLHQDPIAGYAKPMSTISSPPPYATEQSSQGQRTGHDQSSRPPPVAQKPDQRPAFNYLGQSSSTGAGTQRLMYPHLIKPSPRDWSSRLCSCCSDMKSCCGVFWCGCFFYPCFLSSKLGEHTCLPCVMGSTCSLISLRTKLRMQSRIEGTICNDCCTVVCCHCCAMCQMSREHDFVTKHHIVK